MDIYIPYNEDNNDKEQLFDDVSSIFGKKASTKTKKNKKNSKVNDNIDISQLKQMPTFIDLGEPSEGEDASDISSIKFKDIGILSHQLHTDNETENMVRDIVEIERSRYNSRKKEQDEFKRLFAEETTLLYDLARDNSETMKLVEAAVNEAIKNSGNRVRGQMGHTQQLLLQNLNTCRTNQLNIIKEMSNVKKTSAQLAISKSKSTSGEAEGTSSPLDTASFLRMLNTSDQATMLTKGVSMSDSLSNVAQSRFTAEDLKNGNALLTSSTPQDTIGDAIDARMSNSGENFRDESLTKRLIYDNQGAELVIIQENSEWYLEARDKTNTVIEDYPLPDIDTLGNVRFFGNKAKDAFGKQYRVIDLTPNPTI